MQPTPVPTAPSSTPAAPCHDIWAKDPESTPYPLLAHLLDTATVAGAVWDHWLRPGLRTVIADAACGGDLDQARRIAMLLAGIHDVGKANPVFALQAADLRDLEWRTPLTDTFAAHGLDPASDAVVDLAAMVPGSAARRHEYIGMLGMLGAHPNPADRNLVPNSWAAVVVGGHHGRWQSAGLDASAATALTQGAWGAQQAAHLDALETAVGVRVADLGRIAPSMANRVTVLLTGFVILADWLASHGDVVEGGKEMVAAGAVLDATWMQARRTELTNIAINQVGTYTAPVDARATILADRIPRPVQADAITKVGDADGLWIVTYPTGEGKTEASLLRHAARDDEGLVFALPTRATTDAMTTRLRDTFHGTGNAVIKSHQFAAADRNAACACCPDEAPSGWFSTAIRRLLAPVAAMTCDQVLTASLRQHHAPLRLLALANHHVVLDEVHTFDHYQVELLIELLAWLGATNTRVTLLSATMPIWMQRRLAEAYTGVDGEVHVPAPIYPSHRLVSRHGATCHDASSSRPVTLGVKATKSEDPLTDHAAWAIRSAIDHPACHIAVVVNTVNACTRLATMLSAALPDTDVLCLHSRMTQGHRADVEAELLARTGPDAPADTRRVIVVATQVIEASLDVDFDLMATDIAPSASLVQRAGRLWRFHDSDARTARHAASRVAPTRTLRVVAGTDAAFAFTVGSSLPYLTAEMERVWDRGLAGRTHLVVPDEVQEFVDSTTLDLETFHDAFNPDSPYNAYEAAELAEMTKRLNAAADAKAALVAEIATPRRSRYASLMRLTSGEIGEEAMMTRFIERPGHTYLLLDPTGARPDITRTSNRTVASVADAWSWTLPDLLAHAVPVTAGTFDRALLDLHHATLAAAGLDSWEPASRMLSTLLPIDVALFGDVATYDALTGLLTAGQ